MTAPADLGTQSLILACQGKTAKEPSKALTMWFRGNDGGAVVFIARVGLSTCESKDLETVLKFYDGEKGL